MKRQLATLRNTLLCLFLPGLLLAQNVEVDWLEKNKSAKEFTTAAFLKADQTGFYLLRYHRETGQQPTLVVLNEKGNTLHQVGIPGFGAAGKSWFHTAWSTASTLVMAYEKEDQIVYTRSFDMLKKEWVTDEKPLFADAAPKLAGHVKVGFRAKSDGSTACFYRLSGKQMDLAVVDAQGGALWKTSESRIQRGEELLVANQVYFDQKGRVWVQARVYAQGAKSQTNGAMSFHATYLPNGRSSFSTEQPLPTAGNSFSNALFCYEKDALKPLTYYFSQYFKFTQSFEITETPKGNIFCLALGSNAGPQLTDEYITFEIGDFDESKGPNFLPEKYKPSKIPLGLRKAFMSDAAAENKQPIEDIDIRQLEWGTDGNLWALLERDAAEGAELTIGEVALVKFDSTLRMSVANTIDKKSNVKASDPRPFSCTALLPAKKGQFWLLWNQGVWPNRNMNMNTAKGKESAEISRSIQHDAAMLPHTFLAAGKTWYFVGESEDGKTFRIGQIKEAKK